MRSTMDKIVITGFGIKAPGISNIDQFKDVLEQGICTQEILHGRGHNGSNIVAGVIHEDFNMISGQNYKRYPRAANWGLQQLRKLFKWPTYQVMISHELPSSWGHPVEEF